MTFVDNVNITGVTGHTASYRIFETLLSASWTCRSSGDGLAAFSTSGSIFTGVGSGSFKYSNGNSWFVVRQPAGGTREFLFQASGAGSQQLRLVYSYAGAFTGTNNGAISAFVAPTAFDAEAIVGTLANTTSAGASALLWPADSTYALNIRADDSSPYGWYGFAISGLASNAGIAFDPLVANTYPSGDNDPYCIWSGNLIGGISTLVSYGDSIRSFYRKGLTGERFVRVIVLPLMINASNAAHKLGPNPWTGGANIIPVRYGRHIDQGAPSGWKGISSMSIIVDDGRVNKDTISIVASGSRDYIVAGNFAFVWNGSVPA